MPGDAGPFERSIGGGLSELVIFRGGEIADVFRQAVATDRRRLTAGGCADAALVAMSVTAAAASVHDGW